MKTYKDNQNNLHSIEAEFAHMLPVDCVEITQAEFDAILAVKNALTPNQTILQQIAVIEAEQSKPRRTREAVLTQAGRDWFAAQDAAIAALRSQLIAGQH